MAQLYSAAFMAIKDGILRIRAGSFKAVGEGEAQGAGHQAVLETFPVADGWTEHEAIVSCVPIAFDVAYVWRRLSVERPPLGDMGQSDHVLVAYYPKPDSSLDYTIAFFDKDATGTGWLESRTFREIYPPLFWAHIIPPTVT